MTDMHSSGSMVDAKTMPLAPSFDPIVFRDKVRSRPQVTFDELETTPRHLAFYFLEELDKIVDSGWLRHGQHIPHFAPPIPWRAHDRSFRNHLHAWEPLSFLLKGICVAPEQARRERYFNCCRSIALEWIEQFQEPAYAHGPAWAASPESATTLDFAWYDMAVGQRIYRLAFLLDLECRREAVDAAVLQRLYRALVFHHEVLGIETFFRSHTNHGLYQALGQLAAAKRFMDVDARFVAPFEMAQARLGAVLNEHFTQDNVHKEHSPGYHWMLLGSLTGALQTQLITDPLIKGRIREMELAATWMTKPDFGITPFGDSDVRLIGLFPKNPRDSAFKIADRFQTEGLKAIRTAGQAGTLPPAGVKAFQSAGYAFARLYAPEVEPKFENASYLAQIAAFHSRTHKHADHLSFIWHDRQRDILIDPARYAYAGRTEPGTELYEQGFWYSDPKRIYVETTRAHNCVEIDGQSYLRRRHKIYGSALTYAGEQQGMAVTQCDMVHRRYIRHRRVLVMKPGHFLMVIDWLNDRTAPHEYRQFFKFSPEWSVSMHANGYLARAEADETRPESAITVLSLLEGCTATPPVRGQSEPELLGWTSPEAYGFTPASSIHFSIPEGSMARFATLFVEDATATADPKDTKLNATLRNGTLTWKDRFGRHALTLKSDDDGLHVNLHSH